MDLEPFSSVLRDGFACVVGLRAIAQDGFSRGPVGSS